MPNHVDLDGNGLLHAPVAQMDRASAFEADGRGFESLQARQSRKTYAQLCLRLWAAHGEKYTRLTCLFARLLRCENRYIARYPPVFTP
jgi:hypothetical protein